MRGGQGGCSAGVEQPKFTAYVDGPHRVIKFATDATDNARRWQDLLALEHAALQTLQDAGIDAATTQLLDIDGLTCLVVDRFDRFGETGRRAVMTVAAASGNIGGSWVDSAEEMHQQGELGDEGVHRIALLDAFGAQSEIGVREHYSLALFPTHTC